MGIKLGTAVKGNSASIQDVRNKFVAVDALNAIMIFMSRHYGGNNVIPVDKTQRAISHLRGIFYRNINYLKNGMIPVYCFDGKPNFRKRNDEYDKIQSFKNAKKRYDWALKEKGLDVAKHFAMQREFLWPNAIKETKELLQGMGIPYVESPGEGEAQCAELNKRGYCDYVISTDFDVIAFGGKDILKIQELRSNKISAVVYNSKDVLNQLRLDRFQFIDLTLLIGNDYFKGVQGIGLKTGIQLILEYGSLNKILNMNLSSITNSTIQRHIGNIQKQISESNIQKNLQLFMMHPVISNNIHLELNPPIRGRIIELMSRDHNISEEKVTKGIDNLIRAYKKISKGVNKYLRKCGNESF